MRRLAAALALALTLAACGGGGGDGSPSAAPSAAGTPTPTVPPGAQAVRDKVAKALAECPCQVSVATTYFPKPRQFVTVRLVGYYDPRTQASALSVEGDPATKVRIIDGRMFLSTKELRQGGKEWVLLDFAGLPASPVDTLPRRLAAMDPAFAFALGRAVQHEPATSTIPRGELHDDLVFDVAAAQPLTGGGGELFGRLVTPAVATGTIIVGKQGVLEELRYNVLGPGGEPNAQDGVTFVLRKTGVAAQDVSIPRIAGTLDVTKV